jgi:hypothetical protein
VAAAPGAPAQRKFARARKPQVQAETLRPSLRSGLRLIRTLLGEPSRLPPSPQRSFSASLGLSARPRGARTTRLRRPRMAPLVSQRPHVHRIPASRVVTTAIRPSASRRDEPTIQLIRPYEKQKYFCARGLTGFCDARPAGKSLAVCRGGLANVIRRQVGDNGVAQVRISAFRPSSRSGRLSWRQSAKRAGRLAGC